MITAMFVALGFAIFGLAAKYLPIFPEEKAHIPATRANRQSGSSEVSRCLHMPETEQLDEGGPPDSPTGWHVVWPPAPVSADLARSISAKLMVVASSWS